MLIPLLFAVGISLVLGSFVTMALTEPTLNTAIVVGLLIGSGFAFMISAALAVTFLK